MRAPVRRRGRVPGRPDQCARCGVATTSPWPSDEQLAGLRALVPARGGRFSGIGDAVLRRTRSALANRLHRALPPGPVLDVGAGDGTLVGAFRRHGREAIGVDPYAPLQPARARRRVRGDGRRLVRGDLLALARAPAPAGPGAAARGRARRPGGVLVVAVPNATSLQARLFGDRWLALDLPRHLVHISPRRCCPRSRPWDSGLSG